MPHQYIFFYITLYFTGIIIQFSWSQFFSFYGIAPNVIIAFLMFLGLMRGPMTAQVFGFMWGLSWDVLSVDLFGSYAFLYTCLGYMAGQLNRKWDETRGFNQMLLTLCAGIFFWFGIYLLYQVFGPGEYKFRINYIMLVQPFYTMLIAPVVFAFGKKLVDVFDVPVKE